MYKLFLVLAIASAANAIVQAHDHALVRLQQPVVDVILMKSGAVRMFTVDLDAWDADPQTGLWKHNSPQVMIPKENLSIRRVAQFTQVGNVLIGAGHIIQRSATSGASAILRSTDEGRTFGVITIGSDTLASMDNVRRTDDGVLYFLDRVGRAWKSVDTGSSWTTIKLPTQIPAGGGRELDMVKSNMGVCIDFQRNVHFTTNGWGSIITPMVSKKPVKRTQPTFLDYFNWTRRLVMTSTMLYLTEGRDIYKTATNDLLWERWDTVTVFNASDDRTTIAWSDVKERLWTSAANTDQPKLLSDGVLSPQLIRVYPTSVITYREDTGPIIYTQNGSTRIAPYNADASFIQPFITAQGKSREWGIETPNSRSLMIELMYKEGKNGSWKSDTTLRAGPVSDLKVMGADSVVFGTPTNRYVYNAKTRTCAPYAVTRPLALFLSAPITRFRIVVAADELDSTHVRWCEFRLQGANFMCGEVVDSSRFGVQSKTFNKSVASADIISLLNRVNGRGDALLEAQEIKFTEDDVSSFNKMLDTLFVYDGYFDVLDLYRPPPLPEVQILDCISEFKSAESVASGATPEFVTNAILSWRHIPKDEFSRYEIEFENRSGKFARFSVERSDNAHPPLMLPWAGSVDTWRWHCWDRGLTELFMQCMPLESIPPLFVNMARTPWFLAALASYQDGVTKGRWHRWSAGPVTPAARK